jgi:acetylornithine deacetylase
MIDRLVRYVAIRSLSGREDALADAVQAELRAAGLHVQRRENNVWCEIGDAPRPRLFLNSHLDTVPACDGWSHDPWTPRIEGERISGLGANDAKGCVTAMIEAALEAQRGLRRGEPLGGTLVLALTAEEENSGAGLETILDHLRPLDAALVGEPTGMVPMIAQRGLLILRCVAHGRAAHPANTSPDASENAIQTAVRDLDRLRDFDWGRSHPLLGRCHAHVTQIAGGRARNVVPDRCEFVLDVRTTPNEPHQALTERLSALLEGDVQVHSDRLVPVETAAEEPIVQAALRALPGTKPAGSPAMSDMVFLNGIPSVKIGPGASERSHTPNEYVLAREVQDGAAAYGRIVREYSALMGGAGMMGGAGIPAREWGNA